MNEKVNEFWNSLKTRLERYFFRWEYTDWQNISSERDAPVEIRLRHVRGMLLSTEFDPSTGALTIFPVQKGAEDLRGLESMLTKKHPATRRSRQRKVNR